MIRATGTHRWARAALALGAVVSAAVWAGGVDAQPTPPCPSPGVLTGATCRFQFAAGDGTPQTLQVPAGVQMTVYAAGAQGAPGEWLNGFLIGTGGNGGTEQGTFTTTQSMTLTVIVGDSGSQSFSGGGGWPAIRTKGAGGGGSFVFATNTPLVIAGGGGAAGSCTSQSSCAGGNGGAGGDDSGGGPGQDGISESQQGGHGGHGASPAVPGAGGAAGDSVGHTGQDGYGPVTGPGDPHLSLTRDPSMSVGGQGGFWPIEQTSPTGGFGGGGGGGYYGGGGGGESWFGYSGGGGGGGSGYISPQATAVSGSVGTHLGTGQVVISYTAENTVAVTPGDPVNEPAGASTPQTFTVTLPEAQPAATTVTYETVDGSAKADEHAYTPVTQGQLVIAAGQTSGQINIDVDSGSGVAATGTETYQVQLTSVSGGLELSDTRSAATGQINVPGISGTVTDAQGRPMADVALTLSGRAGSGQTVTRQLESGPDGRYSVFADPGSYKLLAVTPKGPGGQLQPSACPDGSPISGGCQLDLQPGARDQIDFNQSGSQMQIDWRMPSRLSLARENEWGAHGAYGLPPKSYVDPSRWKVTLILNGTGAAGPCAHGFSYRWRVRSRGYSQKLPGRGCRMKTTVPRLGVYDVTATQIKNGRRTGYVVENRRVVVRDWLLVGLGDSNGSGEGNPPFTFPQCDRSTASSQYRAAQYVEDHDPRSSVTLLWASCSGARIEHLWHTDYKGIQPKFGGALPPQLTQVQDLIGKRRIDGVIMSVGINDIWFGPLMIFCTAQPILDPLSGPCENIDVTASQDAHGEGSYRKSLTSATTLADATQTRTLQLQAKYAPLDKRLRELHPAHVLITEYPDFSHNQDGSLCTFANGPGPAFPTSTWAWLHDAGDALNRQVDRTALLGWTPITGIPRDFLTHGYCSIDSYFRPLIEAIATENKSGAFHATPEGQAVTLAHTLPALCAALYRNDTCDGIPRS